ncbi:ABC transporter ATP-binding protein [Rossellomorea arthrocnemi]
MNHLFYFIRQLHHLSGRILYYNLIAMMLVSLMEGIGILLLVPLISLIGFNETGSESPQFISWLSQLFNGVSPSLSLFFVLGIYIIIIVGHSFFQRTQLILNSKIQQSFIRHLKESTYNSLLRAKWSFFLVNRKSDIINIMTKEIIRVSNGTALFLQFLTSILFTFLQIVLAFWLSPSLSLCVLFFGIILMLSSKRFIKKSNELGKETIHLSKDFLAGITDHFNGIKDIKSNNLEEVHINWFTTINKQMENNVLKMVRLSTLSQLIYKIVSALLVVSFLYFAIQVYQAQPAQLILIIVIFSRLWPRFSGIQSNLEQMGALFPAFKVLQEIQNESLAYKEFNSQSVDFKKPLFVFNNIECKNLHFKYNESLSTYALTDINISIRPNKMTAIVGPSGAGKSTLIDILMGLNRPDKGEVVIDGKPLTDEKLLTIRNSISYVPQDPFLFNASIRDNLMMINPQATDEDIWKSLEFSSAAEFVKDMPKGLDTMIGDRGIRLSGGERQRIVLARAILRKPSILVLDEATSALDSENEAKIQKAIEQLKGKMTIIVIAHRLSTIRNADQVIVLDKGRVVQAGGFNQLANEKKSMFSNLLEKQMKAIP